MSTTASLRFGRKFGPTWLKIIDVPINGQRVLYWVMPLASSSMHSLGFEPTSVKINAGSTERALASAAILASLSKTLLYTSNIYKVKAIYEEVC